MPRNERFSLPIPRILHDRSLRLFSVRIADLFRNYLIKPTLDYLEITLETDIPDSLPSMALDRIRVRQMLLNLLKNAWEAVPIPGGKISFSVIPENSGIRIDIRDNGCGISKEQQATIFQPFFTTKESGTGLGLAVSKQIAQAHSGDITLESAPGQGTVFHIFLG